MSWLLQLFLASCRLIGISCQPASEPVAFILIVDSLVICVYRLTFVTTYKYIHKIKLTFPVLSCCFKMCNWDLSLCLVTSIPNFLWVTMKSCVLFPPSFSSQGPDHTRRRSDNSQEDLKLESVLSFFLTATSANAIVKKMGAEIAQLLLTHAYQVRNPKDFYCSLKGVPSAESSRSVQGLGKGVSGEPYPRLCNARRPRLEPGTFRSQAVRLYRLHQARPSLALLTIAED